jgi:CheY-like chemotaxis protein
LVHKILVVEDHDGSSDLFNTIVQSMGYQTICARNGREGVDKAIRERPDLIVMDLMMPVMDGIEAIARIKASLAAQHAPIVVLTATLKDDLRTDAIGAGAAEVLYKPVDIATLCKTVRKYLRPTTPARLVLSNA